MLVEALIRQPVAVLAVLLGVVACLFAMQHRRTFRRVYRVVPILLFCYFVPTALSNAGVIPSAADFSLYVFATEWLLPASLVLLVLAVDIPGIVGLGRQVVILFSVAGVSIVLGGPLAYLVLGGLVAPDDAAQVWRGLAALCGSWLGGSANMTAVKESVGLGEDVFSAVVVVDVTISSIWMAVLLWFAGRSAASDAVIGADRAAVLEVQAKAEAYRLQTARPAELSDVLAMLALAFGATAVAHLSAPLLERVVPHNEIVTAFTWKVILVTLFGLVLSFTAARELEGAGASTVGSVFLYLLVATIGAKANFVGAFTAGSWPLLPIAALWMAIHATAMLVVRRALRAPMFFAAIGSQSCVGGTVSAPIVAAAFHPALAPVGVLLAIAGYLIGTVGGIACAFLLELVGRIHQG